MKLSSLLAASVAVPLGAFARNLPHYNALEDDGTPELKQSTHITAFTIDEKGTPRVECRAVSSTTETLSRRRRDGSRATMHSTRLGASEGDEVDVEISTWPSKSPIYPPPADGDVQEQILLFLYPCFFSVTRGIVLVNNYYILNNMTARDEDNDDDGQYIFGPDNGDNWFYFEDNRASEDRRNPSVMAQTPLTVETASGGNTQVIGITHSKTPGYKKLHDGPCRYTGVEVDESESNRHSGKRIGLNVQIEEL